MKNSNEFILVVNQFNCDNLGDNLLNDILCKNIENYGYKTINCGFAQTEPQRVIYDNSSSSRKSIYTVVKERLPEHIKYIVKYRSRLDNEIRNINGTDCRCLVIGGGQLLKHNSVFLYCLRHWVLWAKKKGIPSFLFGVGVDTGLSLSEIQKYRSILSLVNHITCRDHESQRILLDELEIKSVSCAPDIAFLLDKRECKQKEGILVMPYSYSTAVRAFDFRQTKDDYYLSILHMINKLGDNHNVYLGATTTSDAEECSDFHDYLKENQIKSTIVRLCSVEELISAIMASTCVITGRMHAMIICKVMNIPVMPILVSDKIKQFTKEYLDDSINIENIRSNTNNGLKDLINRIGEGKV